jgi:flagellar FliJ protein
MKKFNFRLEKILQLRTHFEKEKQKILGQAIQKVVAQDNALSDIDQTRRQTQNQQRTQLHGKIDTNLMSMFSRYYLKLKKNELAGRELLDALRIEQEKKRLDLVKATREKKIYEKLKERKFEDFQKEYQLQLQKEQDEMATQMLLYKKRPPL